MNRKTLFINEKLELRLPELEYAESLFKILEHQREYMEKWLPWANKTKNLKDCQKQLKTYKLFNTGGQKLTTFIFFEEKLAGSVALVKIFKENQSAEIGYWLSQDLQGKGIITQSCERIIQYSFKKMKINRLEINVATLNLRSINIAKRLKFSHEGTLRDGLFINEQFYDLEKYSLLKREWIKRR